MCVDADTCFIMNIHTLHAGMFCECDAMLCKHHSVSLTKKSLTLDVAENAESVRFRKCVCLILATSDSLFAASWSVCLSAFVSPAVALSPRRSGSLFVVFVALHETYQMYSTCIQRRGGGAFDVSRSLSLHYSLTGADAGGGSWGITFDILCVILSA